MTTDNAWLDVSLADYEGHMALPHVAQAQLLSDLFARLLARCAPRSVAIAGCAGGNGLERIDPAAVDRVVGIDINSDFLESTRLRYAGRFRSFQLVRADIERDAIDVEPVDLVYAALLLEYTDASRGFAALRSIARRHIAIVSQMPSTSIPEITPSPYTRLSVLERQFRFVAPATLQSIASAFGCVELESSVVRSDGGKEFSVQLLAVC